MGGINKANFLSDYGPWNDYELIDGPTPDKIGVKRIGDPHAKIFGPKDMIKLQNPLVTGMGTWGTKGAVKFKPDGQMVPNNNATISEKIENEAQICMDDTIDYI